MPDRLPRCFLVAKVKGSSTTGIKPSNKANRDRTMRFWHIIGCICSLLVLGAMTVAAPPRVPDTTVQITFSAPAMSAPKLLDALSKQTHVSLVCSPEIQQEILLLHVQGISLRDVMDRIAEAIGARWRLSGKNWILERPAEMAKAQQEQEFREQAAQITPLLNRLTGVMRKPWNATTLRAAATRYRKYANTGQIDTERDQMDPVYRAFLRSISDVTPDAIARIPTGGRVVFATEPTPMQKPLGKGAQEAIAKLAEEQKIFGKTLRSVGVKPGFEDEAHDFSAFSHDAWRRLSPYPTTPSRILLKITRSWGSSYEAEFLLLNKKHQVIVTFRGEDSVLNFAEPWKEPIIPKVDTPIPLSARTRTLLSVGRNSYDNPSVSPAALRLLTHPEQYEPLSMRVSDGYLGLARLKKRNLIAALPDALLDDTFRLGRPKSLTVSDVRGWSCSNQPMRITDRNGWLVVTLPHPWEERPHRIDRATLGRIARRIAQRGSYRLEDIVEFAAHAGKDPLSGFGDSYLWAVSKGKYGSSGRVGDATLFAVYGAMTPAQQKALNEGKTIRYDSLTPWQRTIVERAVFAPHSNFSATETGTTPPDSDLYDEPTEFNLKGLPANGVIRLKRQLTHPIHFIGPGKTEDERHFRWIIAEKPTGFYTGPPSRIPAGGLDAFRYDVRTQMNITIEVDITPWYRMSVDSQEVESPASGPPVPFAQLPADLKKPVQEELKVIRQLAGERS